MLFRSDRAVHAHTLTLGRMSYFDNWDCKKEAVVFLLRDFRLPSESKIVIYLHTGL